MFDEKSLRAALIKTWGIEGDPIIVYDELVRRLKKSKEAVRVLAEIACA